MTTTSIAKAIDWSNYLRMQLQAKPDLLPLLEKNILLPIRPNLIDLWLSQSGIYLTGTEVVSVEHCKKGLRDVRRLVFCSLMLRDINQLATFEEVTHAMSYLADVAIMAAYRSVMHDLVEVHGVPTDAQTGQALEMIVLGMGKLGGNELNVSSDIDLIMLYPEEGETTGRRPLSYHEFYGRLTRRMMPIISEQTADGQVFRTDLRLRPDGDGGPLAWSLDAVENYLITQGREWERYAWLKARVIPVRAFQDSNPEPHINYFKSIQTPFVYRKYFDFDALSALRNLREQIRQDWQRKASNRSDIISYNNIKLGEGGIREVEFIVQLQQLIRGGRMASLRVAGLLPALKQEAAAGLLNADDSLKLEQAYRFLRHVEHMLQYRDDAQTQLLPSDPATYNLLARSMGYDSQQFSLILNGHRNFVSNLFKNAFRLAGLNEEHHNTSTDYDSPSVPDEDDIKRLIDTLFKPEAIDTIKNHITALFNSYRIKTTSTSSRNRLYGLIPAILKAAANATDPVLTSGRMFDLIESIAQRSAYLALLAEYPETLERVARILGASPWVAGYLTNNPLLLDSLIDWRSLLEPVNIKAVGKQLIRNLDSCVLENGEPDVEQQMNIMRDIKKQVTFQLLAQNLENELTVEVLADQLSALADMILQESIKRVWQLLRTKKPEIPPTPNFAIIAYGRLGGKELGYTSDLDLVFLYDDHNEYAVEVYSLLARRLTTWLSSMTSSDRLYEIDMRLRPDGDAGLLAASIEGFRNYEFKHAWMWEHQAITRARFAAGDVTVGEKFEAIRREILLLPRNIEKLKQDILEMRIKMRDGHPNKTPLFDIKHDSGGMVDVEFITQFLILAYAHQYPTLLKNLGNISLLKFAGQVGLIPANLAIEASDAYRAFRKQQHAIRLLGHERARIDPVIMDKERQSVIQLWQFVFHKGDLSPS